MSVAANRYAKALIEALPQEKAEAGYEQLKAFEAVLQSQNEAKRLFENPTVPPERRKTLATSIGNALGFDVPLMNFVHLLIERNRLGLLEEIVQSFEKLLDQRLGIIRASVTAAGPLDSAQRERLESKLATMTGKKVRMQVNVDPALVGGVIARVGGTIYDGSLRQQLNTFRAKLAEE